MGNALAQRALPQSLGEVMLGKDVSPIVTIDVCLEELEIAFVGRNILGSLLVGVLIKIRASAGPLRPASLLSLF